ncbi:MAG: sigma-70 family RNA polymerase sigma factor [Planctomycetes bacterium]|nr:sigma-70 family RNA polymerase sigma factor [Planctomycetota bacterium]
MDKRDTYGGPFPSTHPSLVAHVGHPESPEHREAWETFFRGYWPPLYAYLRRSGSSREEALDLLQDFLLAGVEGRVLSRYDPARGRFRTFLLACLANLRRKARRHDRVRPDRRALRIGSTAEGDAFLEARPDSSPEEVFESDWVRQVGARGRGAFEARLQAAGDELSLRLVREWVFAERRPAGAELARELGITPSDLYSRATRLRHAFATQIELEVRAWSGDPERERREVISSLLGRRD